MFVHLKHVNNYEKKSKCNNLSQKDICEIEIFIW